MPTVMLTDRFCSSVKAIGGSRTDYFDEQIQGLALRVTENGHRSWCFHYRSPRDGKRARATIGTYPGTSLAAARGRASEARGHVEGGQDPRLALAGQASAEMRVTGLVEVYVADLAARAVRSKAEVERRLRKNVIPMIGDLKVAELRRRDVRNVTDPIVKRGSPTEAIRVFEDVRGMVRWAVQGEYMAANPLDGASKPAESMPRDRVLSDDEIGTLWRGLPKSLARSKDCQRIVKLCLLTAQRSGEVAGLVPAELDLKAREWRLPAARTKNGHPHVVPLTDLAIKIIKEAIEAAGEGKPLFGLSSEAVARTILRANETSKERPRGRFNTGPWSAHDLRRTALTGMARLGVAPIVLGHVANHRTTTRAGVTLSVYSQYTYDAEKRAALELWADRLAAIVGKEDAAKVVSIRKVRR
jgi:integrase